MTSWMERNITNSGSLMATGLPSSAALTPLTNDVLGSLWPDEVTAALQKISSWKK